MLSARSEQRRFDISSGKYPLTAVASRDTIRFRHLIAKSATRTGTLVRSRFSPLSKLLRVYLNSFASMLCLASMSWNVGRLMSSVRAARLILPRLRTKALTRSRRSL